MGVTVDISGRRFGMLVAVSRCGNSNGRIAYLCECDCGNTKEILKQSLMTGRSKSCGCASKKYDLPSEYDVDTYKLWHTMIRRCENEKTNGFKNYGLAGVMVCDRWKGKKGFINFISDMGERPSKKYSIDRVDSDGNYEPDNCRWATLKEQARNRKTNTYLTLNGVTKIITDWAAEIGINQQTISARLKNGWSVERALTEPVHTEHRAKTYGLW